MPAKRRLTESQAEAFRILCGFTRRRQLLASLEKERLSVERRLLELASRPAPKRGQSRAIIRLHGESPWFHKILRYGI